MQRIFTFLMGLLCLSLSVSAQQDILDKQVSISYNQVKLGDILDDLQKKYDLKFTYANDQILLGKKVSLAAENKKISEILDELFSPLQIEYHLINHKIILKSKKDNIDEKAKNKNISGIVREKGSLESLPGATIYIPELKRGAVTNNYGFYSINMDPGEYTLEVSFVGYTKAIQPISSDESQKIDIELEPSAALQEVVINADKDDRITETTQMSSIDIPVSQIKNTPGFFGEKDVFKVLQLLPGVQKGTDLSSSVYVRGGNQDQNLIILDDAVVYNVNHFFGLFSVFNGDAIKSIQLIKGGFPARFGERLSSVLVLNMKDGNKEEIHGEVGIGLLSSRFTLEGPIRKNKSSFLIAGRRTYADILITPFAPKHTKAGYYFYDLNAKYHTEIDDKNRVYLSGYFGRDKMYLKNISLVDTKSETANDFGWGNATFTARWNHIFNNKIFSNTSLIYSHYGLGISQDDKDQDGFYRLRYTSSITDMGAKFDVDYALGTQHYFRVGARTVWHNFIPSAVVTEGSAANQNVSKKNPFNSFENNLFMEDDWHISEFLALNAGLRSSSFTAQGKTYINAEPRLSAKAMLAPDLALKTSYSRMNQYMHLLSNTGVGLPTDLWIPATKKISPQRADQFAIGLDQDFSEKKLTLSIEGYYKKMYHIIAYKPGASFLGKYNPGDEIDQEDFSTTEPISWEDNITIGNGRSYGAEFLLQKKSGKFSGWFGYTLAWVKFKFNELNDGKEFYPQQDHRHNVSLVGIYQASPKMKLSFSWTYSSGAPLNIPFSNYTIQTQGPVPSYGNNTEVTEYSQNGVFRTDPFHRLDIGAQFTKQKKHGERTWEIGVYNVYNHINPFIYYPNSKDFTISNDGATSINTLNKAGLPIVPSVSYSYKF